MVEIIGGRFEIGEALGQGGMGMVYHGRDTQSGQAVAIKLLKPELVTSNRELVERFIREGEALRRLNHPNIVKMLASIEENDQRFLVMEYVEGGSLAELLATERQLPVDQVLHIALELADALTRAHHLKIIHRDIKPANVLLAQDGTPRLTDFGIARLDDQSRMTESGLVVGTFAYLSPEACEGRELDARTDIWSFGVMLYEMLTGRKPFQAETTAATITSILMHTPPDLARLRPDTPPTLVALISRMLQKDRDKRLSSVRQVGAELEAILHGDTQMPTARVTGETTGIVPLESRFSTPTPPMDDSPTTMGASPQTPSGKTRSKRSLFTWLTALIGLFVVGLIVLASGVLQPGSVPTPTFEPVEAGIYRVVVAPFEAVRTETRDVGRFITDDLKQRFEIEAPFSQINIETYPTVITSDEEALIAAEATGASVIVWGNYSSDKVTANIQVGSLGAFKYNHFERDLLERTANVRAEMTDETQQSLASQVLGVLGVLFNADGDLYGISRTWVTLEALKSVTPAAFAAENIAVYTQRYFTNYNDNPEQSVEEITTALNQDAGNALLYAFRAQAVYRTIRIKGGNVDPTEPSEGLKHMWADGDNAQQFGPSDWPLGPVLDFSSAYLASLSIELSQRLIDLRPDDWYLYFLRATRLVAAPDSIQESWEIAKESLDRAIELQPGHAFPKAFAVYVALWQGRLEDAAGLADDVRSDIGADTFFAERLLLTEWAMTISGSPSRPGTLYSPFSKLVIGQYQEARDIIVQQALAGVGGDPFLLGLAQCGLGDFEKAQLAFSGISQRTSGGYITNLLKGLIDLKQGNQAAALGEIGVVQQSDQAELLIPFAAAVLNRDFECGDLFTSAKIAAVMGKYGTVTAADISATLTAVTATPDS